MVWQNRKAGYILWFVGFAVLYRVVKRCIISQTCLRAFLYTTKAIPVCSVACSGGVRGKLFRTRLCWHAAGLPIMKMNCSGLWFERGALVTLILCMAGQTPLSKLRSGAWAAVWQHQNIHPASVPCCSSLHVTMHSHPGHHSTIIWAARTSN